MGDMGDYWRDVKPILKEKRQKHVANSGKGIPARLLNEGLTFEVYEATKQFAIHAPGETVDYWATTGTWIFRKSKKRGRGIGSLLTEIKNRS